MKVEILCASKGKETVVFPAGYIESDKAPALINSIESENSGDRVYPSIFCRFSLYGKALTDISCKSEAIYREYIRAVKNYSKACVFVTGLSENGDTEAELAGLKEQARLAASEIDNITGMTEAERIAELIDKELEGEAVSSLLFTVTGKNALKELYFYGLTTGVSISDMTEAGLSAIDRSHPVKLARKEFIDGVREFITGSF